ncbi:hypothetical protein BGW41_002390 [Actinomortierella wolfii]|nr:hypothetical protein BGW41_002390 [Actinomortierella wolfii]
MRRRVTLAAENAANEIRQGYVQRYLKQFLRRVHPDLFQHYPSEQAQNSASLQELLPLVGHDKQKKLHVVAPPISGDSSSSSPLTTKLAFYVRPISKAAATLPSNNPPLALVEHHLPVPHVTPSPTQTVSLSGVNIQELEQELRSWEMVRSFLELCAKVGVSVAEADQQYTNEQYQELNTAIQQAETNPAPKHTEKSLKEIFAEELQGSFAGSTGKTSQSVHSSKTLSSSTETQTWKVGGGLDVEEQARRMIESNKLLFTSEGVTRAGLEKMVRKWLHWQEEDRRRMYSEQLRTSEAGEQTGDGSLKDAFRLQDWWRKVPTYVAENSQEQKRIQLEMQRQGRGGMIVVAQDSTKEAVQAEYQRSQQEQMKQPAENDAGAEYVARMRAKYLRAERERGRNGHWRRK